MTMSYALADRQASSVWNIRKLRQNDKATIIKRIERAKYHGITLAWQYFGSMLDPQMSVPSSIVPSLEAQSAQLAVSHRSAEGAFSAYVSAIHTYSRNLIAHRALNHPIDTILLIPSAWSDEARTTAMQVRLHSVNTKT
jgi:hypothetical protein